MQTVTLDIWPPRKEPAIAMCDDNGGRVEVRFALQLTRESADDRWSLAHLWVFEATWYPYDSKVGSEIETVDNSAIKRWFVEFLPEHRRDDLQRAASEKWEEGNAD